MKIFFIGSFFVFAFVSARFSPWKIVIASKDEPGERMIVSGRVIAADGKTPVAGIRVQVYHTDAKGYYNPGMRRVITTPARRVPGTLV
ncbi:MAG: hypothetical protein HYY49_12430 [Ignavibacteriales bacterium]|nr:hypothetical protein [Ignavibacteriales bacterium]